MVPPRPDTFEIVVLGWGFNDWRPVLSADSPIWQNVPATSIIMQMDGWKGDGRGEHQLILPLREENIRECPTGWAMVPPSQALEVFADKALFAAYINHNGLNALAPAAYPDRGSVVYPCVLKRTNLDSSEGVNVVWSAEDLNNRLTEEPYAGHPVILQEFIEARKDFTTHVVAVDGIFVWHKSLEIALPDGYDIRYPKPNEQVHPVDLSARDLFMLQRLVAPSRFTGPFNIGYRRRPTGEMAILEINPRLGGTLFRPAARPYLTDAMGVIATHARWHEARF